MTRLIDGDALIELINGGYDLDFDEVPETKRELLRMIMEQPTVDAVPVIRCKNCKFSKAYYHGSESNLGMFTYLCTQGLYGMNADGYCSRAERKEE